MSKPDAPYFEKKLRLVLRDIEQYTAAELALELYRLASTANPTIQSARINELGEQLSAITQRAEAAESRIKASQEQEHVGYITETGIYKKDLSFTQAVGDVVFKWTKLYAAPVIQPDVAELQRENEFYRGEYRVLSENGFGTAMDAVIQANFSKARAEENAELTRKLAEQQAIMKNYDFDESDYAELTKLLAEAKSKAVPEGHRVVPDEILFGIVGSFGHGRAKNVAKLSALLGVPERESKPAVYSAPPQETDIDQAQRFK